MQGTLVATCVYDTGTHPMFDGCGAAFTASRPFPVSSFSTFTPMNSNDNLRHLQSISSDPIAPGGSRSSISRTVRSSRQPSASRVVPSTAACLAPDVPLPGVSYIIYPATPDLTSSCSSLENLDGCTIGDDNNVASCQNEEKCNIDVEGAGAGEDNLLVPRRRACRRQNSTSTDDSANRALEGLLGNCGASSSSTCSCPGNADESTNQGSQEFARAEERRSFASPLSSSRSSSSPVLPPASFRPSEPKGLHANITMANCQDSLCASLCGSSLDVRANTGPQGSRCNTTTGQIERTIGKGELMSTETGRRVGAPGRGKGRRALRQEETPDWPPQVLKVLPSLPGVDEHQRPPFRLAEMHENMRQIRCVKGIKPSLVTSQNN